MTNDHDWVSLAASVFAGFEAAAERRMDAEGVEIIGGDDAAGDALGAIANAESGTGDFGNYKGVDEFGTFLQIENIRPGDTGGIGLAASGSGDSEKPVLVSDRGIGTKEEPFNPTEDSGIGSDAESETQNHEDGKAGATEQHANAEAKILQDGFEHGEAAGLAIKFLGLLNAAEKEEGLAASLFRGQAATEELLSGHFKVRFEFGVELAFEFATAE
jgi:hypothetical protein